MDNNELVRRAQNGDKNSMEQLIIQNERLVRSVVKRFLGRGTEAEDLYQIGCIGMVRAAQKFDFSMNVMFSTYAVPMIMGEIRRFLRDDGMIKVSRSIKETSRRVCAETENFIQQNGRQPTVNELSSLLGISIEDVTTAISASASPLSIYEKSDDDSLSLMDKLVTGEHFDEKIIDSVSIAEVTKALPKREREIIDLRYFQNKTQAEIAQSLELSQAQVSRIEKCVIQKLKKQLV